MKTHELAKALTLLARMLRAGPNVPLQQWHGQARGRSRSGSDEPTAADAGLALSVLVGLSKFTKQQWQGYLAEWGLSLEVRRTDSVRDLVGRLLNYLNDHPDVAKRIKNDSTRKSTKSSPELNKVLSILLGEQIDESKSGSAGGGA